MTDDQRRAILALGSTGDEIVDDYLAGQVYYRDVQWIENAFSALDEALTWMTDPS